MPINDNDAGYSPIQCQIYDYFEIACMRHYQIELKLTSSETITGKAITTTSKNQQEFIVIETENENDGKQEIRLDLVNSIQPLDRNAEFGLVSIH